MTRMIVFLQMIFDFISNVQQTAPFVITPAGAFNRQSRLRNISSLLLTILAKRPQPQKALALKTEFQCIP